MNYVKPEQLLELVLDICPTVVQENLLPCLDIALNLEKLYISACRSLEELLLLMTSNLRPNLTEFTVASWAPSINLTDMRFPYRRMLQAFPNLTVLRVPRNDTMPISLLSEICMGLSNLVVLDISESKFKENDLVRASIYLSRLQKFIMDKPNNFVTFTFLFNLTSLRRLRIRSLDPHINIKNIVCYALHHYNLKTIDLRAMECTSTTEFIPLRDRGAPLTIYLRDTELANNVTPMLYIPLRHTVLDFVN